MAGTVAVVTDSTAFLAPDLAGSHDIRVVPLRVVLAGQVHDETPSVGLDITAALRAGMTVCLASLDHLRRAGNCRAYWPGNAWGRGGSGPMRRLRLLLAGRWTEGA